MENLNNIFVEKLIKSDSSWVKSIYKSEAKHLGTFNLFWTWDKYISGEAAYSFVGFREMAFVRFGYSRKYKSYVIYEIGVHNDYKRQGLAKKLVISVSQIAKRKGTYLMLKCNQDNVVGNKFYASIGMTLKHTTATKKGEKQNVWTI